MKMNQARRQLLDGGIISGISLLYPSPEIAEEAVRFGFDFVVLDWQHGPWSEPTLNAALACFTYTETIPLVRIPGPDAHWIGKVLDLGAFGVIVPMVETAEQCQAIVRAAKFPPRGTRSATGLRTAYYTGGDGSAYAENANSEILVVVMVETAKAVNNLQQILAIPDIDCVLIGPYDLTRSINAHRPDEPEVEELVRDVLETSMVSGVAAGYYTNYPAEAEVRVAQGFRMVFLGHDMVQLPDAFAEMQRASKRFCQMGGVLR